MMATLAIQNAVSRIVSYYAESEIVKYILGTLYVCTLDKNWPQSGWDRP
jgi:hypothetical protein